MGFWNVRTIQLPITCKLQKTSSHKWFQASMGAVYSYFGIAFLGACPFMSQNCYHLLG